MLRSEKHLRWLGLDMRPRWRRRVGVVVTYFALIAATSAADGSWWGHPFIAMLFFNTLVMSFGIFSPRGLVKPLTDPPERIVIEGLDQWAMYRYAVPNFDAATPAQQAYLLRKYRVGRFLVPAKPWLDERELKERDQLDRWAMQWVLSVLGVQAGMYAVGHAALNRMEVVGTLSGIALLGRTLPQARVLWYEADPRELSGEMELVMKEV